MSDKILFYAMRGEKMCFQHILLNALDLHASGREVKIIFEGASVTLVPQFEEEQHALYLKVREAGLIAGVCLACSQTLGVLEANRASGLPLLSDMNGHAPMRPYVEAGYQVVSL